MLLCGLNISGSCQGPEVCSCDHGNENWNFTKVGLIFLAKTFCGEDYITRNLMTCTHHQILFG
jgi:hypothetical protein